MRALAVTLIAVFALGACQSPCPAPDTGPVTAEFACEDGSRLNVTFTRSPDLARVEEEGYAPLSLPGRPAGSGYRYSGAGAELRGRGAETLWTRPGAPETVCREAARARAPEPTRQSSAAPQRWYCG